MTNDTMTQDLLEAIEYVLTEKYFSCKIVGDCVVVNDPVYNFESPREVTGIEKVEIRSTAELRKFLSIRT